uniref:PDZ domain-containing protein n=1 Tax=Parastrongyloides trichosuri TaxID=131310 RepID=A0A0N4ZNY4_PARTI
MNEGHRYDIMEATSVLRIHIYPDQTEEILTVVSPISVDTESSHHHHNSIKNQQNKSIFSSPTLSPGEYYTDSGIDSSSNFVSPQQGFSPERRRESSSIYFIPIHPLQIPEEDIEEEERISEETLSLPSIDNNKKDTYQLTRSNEKTFDSSSTINSSEIDIPEGDDIYIEEEIFHEEYQNILLKEDSHFSETIEEGHKEIYVIAAESTVSYLIKNSIQESGFVDATVFPKPFTSITERIKIYPFTKKSLEFDYFPLYEICEYHKTNKKSELLTVPLYDHIDYIKHNKKKELDFINLSEVVDIKEYNKLSVVVEASKENIGSVVAYRYPTSSQHLVLEYSVPLFDKIKMSTSYSTYGRNEVVPLDEIYPSSKAFPQMNKHIYKQDILRNNSITSVRSNAPDINGVLDIQMTIGKNYVPTNNDSFGFYVRGGIKKNKESTLVVSHVREDSPADICGLVVGDNIIAINNVTLDNLSLIKAERLYEESIKEKNISIKIIREKKFDKKSKNEIVLLKKTTEMVDKPSRGKGDYKISSFPQSDLGEEMMELNRNDPKTIYRNNKNDKSNIGVLNIKTHQQSNNNHSHHSPTTSVINSTVLNFSPTSYTTSGIESNHSFSPRSDSDESYGAGGMSDYKVSRLDRKYNKVGKVTDFVPDSDRSFQNKQYTDNDVEQDYHAAGLSPIQDVDSQPRLIRNYDYKLIEKNYHTIDNNEYNQKETHYLPPNRQVSYDDEAEEIGKDFISKSCETISTLQRCPVVEMHPQYEKNRSSLTTKNGSKKKRSSGARRSLEKSGKYISNNISDNEEDNESYITAPSRIQSILKSHSDDDIYYDVKNSYNTYDDNDYEEVKVNKKHSLNRQVPLNEKNKVNIIPDEEILKEEEINISEGVVRYYDRDMQQIGRAYSYEESTTTSLIEDQEALRKLVRQQRLPAPGDPFSKNRIDADNRYEVVSKSIEKLKKKQETENIKSEMYGGEQVKAVSGRKLCGHCDRTLGQGAAMIIESLKLQFHLSCFRCIHCNTLLGNGTTGTDVRVRGRKLYCKECYHLHNSNKIDLGSENKITTSSSKMLNRIQV